MASGDRCLVLEGGIDYDSFPSAAEKWANKLDLTITERTDGPDARVWLCEKGVNKFWLAYDDWFPELHLDPQDAAASDVILNIGRSIGASSL